MVEEEEEEGNRSHINTQIKTFLVGIATGCTARVRFPAVQDFSLLHNVQTGSGAHPASYPRGTGDSFLGGKAAGA
jgi:hypothetical protein